MSKTGSISIDQAYEFCATFKRRGGSTDLLQELIDNNQKMTETVAIARDATILKKYKVARLILGDNFISPEEDMAKKFNVSYTKEQREHFGDTLPNVGILRELRRHNIALIPGPRKELNLFGVYEIDGDLFSHFFVDDVHGFVREDSDVEVVEGGGWIAIRKTPHQDSFSKEWVEQRSVLSENEYIPNVTQVAYAIAIYYKVNGICLFSGSSARCASVVGNGHVTINVSKVNGMDRFLISTCPDTVIDNEIGATSAWRL